MGEVDVPVRRASAGEHGSLNLAAAAVVPGRLAREAARLPGLDHDGVGVEHGGEEGPSRHRPVTLDPGAAQLGVRGSRGLQLASILGSVEVRVVGEQRGAVDEPALGLRLDVRRPGASREGVTASQPAVAGAAGVGCDDEAGAEGHGSPQAGAEQVERRGVGVLAGLVGRDQSEALALKLGEVVDALRAGRAGGSRRWESARCGWRRCSRLGMP